jgi:hemoglobin-like flavoprotein
MRPEQQELIRRSFALVQPIAPLAATLFYNRLFEIAPQTQALFRYAPDSLGMVEQGTKLMQMLAVAVAHLDSFEQIAPAVEALACRHVAYGVEPAHYNQVGAALLWTLEQGLGPAYTPEVAAAWTALYQRLAETMLRAAYAEPIA